VIAEIGTDMTQFPSADHLASWLRARLGRAGIETAQEYAWERRIDALEAFFQRVAASRRMALGGELAPSLVRSP
jgi:hypothetical protein